MDGKPSTDRVERKQVIEVEIHSLLVIFRKVIELSIASYCLETINALVELGVDRAFRDCFMSLRILLNFQDEISQTD